MHKGIDPAGYGFVFGKADWVLGSYDPFFAPLIGKAIKLLELGVRQGASLRLWRDYFENATIVGLDCDQVHIDDPTGMIHVYQGYQQDIGLLDRIAREQAPNGFDVIIDDCSHIGRFARISFWHLFQNHLKPGGLYAIEDWGTGYSYGLWALMNWPDGGHYKTRPQLKYPAKHRFVDSLHGWWYTPIFPHFPRISKMLTRSKVVTKTARRLLTSTIIPSHTHGMAGFVKELLDASAIGEGAIPRSGSGRYLEYDISHVHIIRDLVIVEKAAERHNNKQ